MNKYLVVKKQKGEGCDYMIGCGMRYDIVEAKSLDDVIDKTIYPEGIDEYSIFDMDISFDEIYVVPYNKVYHLDLDEYERIHRDRIRRANEEKRKEFEEAATKQRYADYLKLKEEFEND